MSPTPTTTERRSLLGTAPTATGRTISGYAALFSSRSENLGSSETPWFEVLAPGCFPDIKTQDVRALVGHDEKLLLARSNKGVGTLQLSVDAKGLRFSFECPRTQYGEDLLESITRKDIDACSFGFVVAKGGEKRTLNKDGSALRTITKIEKLLELSIVAFPAYSSTTVSARSRSNKAEHPTISAARRRLDLLAK